MLVVRDIRVRSFSTEYAHIVWQIEPTAEDITEYDFYVLRSGGQSGPYTVVGGPLVDQYIWRDNRAKDGSLWAPYYYRIRVVHRSSGNEQDYGERTPEETQDGTDIGGVSRNAPPPADALESIYRMRLLLDRFGRDIFLFQRRVFGQRCPDCWDEIKSVRTISNCRTCYDTGFVAGFFRPIATRVLNANNPNKADYPDAEMRKQPAQKSFRFSAYPEVKPRDVVIDSRNDRWRANLINPSERGESLVSQVVTCARIPKSDIEYSLPLRGIDPIRLEFEDELNHRPAYNLEALSNRKNRYHPPEV